MGLSPNTICPVSAYYKRLPNVHRHLREFLGCLQKAPISSQLGNCESPSGDTSNLYRGSMPWDNEGISCPLQDCHNLAYACRSSHGGPDFFSIEGFGTVFAFNLFLLLMGFLWAFNLPKAGNFLLQPSSSLANLLGSSWVFM